MKAAEAGLDYRVRAYEPADEDAVVDLLRASLGEGPTGNRTKEFFRWKHVDNPFGRSLMLVADHDGEPVGLRAFMRWRFAVDGRVIRAASAVDTATHPRFQGRGIFTRLTLDAVEALREDTDLIFNTPNDKSGPGYLKMGWQLAGKVPISVRVRRPVRFVAGLRSARSDVKASGEPPHVAAPPAGDIFAARADEIDALLLTRAEAPGRMTTLRNLSYLRWRYADIPGLRYHALSDWSDGHLTGLGIFRVRARGSLWETSIAELLVASGDTRAARRLLRAIGSAAATDHVACHLSKGGRVAGAARRAGYVSAPVGVTLAVRTLTESLTPDPVSLHSWNLSLGDIEVF